MSNKPVFVATHPRACSTAFERVFMTCRDTITTIHEPFGDAFYFGPERMSPRYEEDEEARIETGFSNSTYKSIFDRIARDGDEGKRLFIKDIIHYLVPPDGKPAEIAPSLDAKKRGIGTEMNGAITNGTSKTPYPYHTTSEPGNPTVVPMEMLSQFHFTFLIRDPHSSIPSYYRCTIPPLDRVTGFYNFYPSEAGYDEVRRVFDYLRNVGQIGPNFAQPAHRASTNGKEEGVQICVVDADDLLDDPNGIISTFCKTVGIEYDPGMLSWDTEEDQRFAKDVFAKWKGFHEDAIESKDLKPRVTNHKAGRSEAEWDAEWENEYGAEGARLIRQTVDNNMKDYLYMKQFALKA